MEGILSSTFYLWSTSLCNRAWHTLMYVVAFLRRVGFACPGIDSFLHECASYSHKQLGSQPELVCATSQYWEHTLIRLITCHLKGIWPVHTYWLHLTASYTRRLPHDTLICGAVCWECGARWRTLRGANLSAVLPSGVAYSRSCFLTLNPNQSINNSN